MDFHDAATRSQDPNLHVAIASYLQSFDGAYDLLLRLIKYRRRNKSPEAPLDDEEYDLRCEYIRAIIEKQRKVRGNEHWMVSHIQFAYLLRMDPRKLEDFSITCGKQGFLPCQGQPILDSWGALTRHFFEPSELWDCAGFELPSEILYTTDKINAEVPGSEEEPSMSHAQGSEEPDDPIDRSQETFNLCLQLDNDTCVVTGYPLAFAGFIVPIEWNCTNEYLEYTKSLTSALSVIIDNPAGEEPLEHLKRLYDHKGSIDKSWNVISVSRDLYQLWRRGLWALKWLSAVALPEDPLKSRITLQFHWLKPWNTIPTLSATLKDENEALGSESALTASEDIYPPSDEVYVIARDHKSRQSIKSGDICTIIRFTEDIDKCKQMFDIQWEICNAAADSGFTGHANIDEEVEWDLDGEELPSEDEEWVMTDGSEGTWLPGGPE
ncbi:uncharacterized protein FIESC28_00983 [Fusarium coffeatum]|uniref:HNH nuclease domain-containing protein n=1 Tax=Fusarium coffeatum TaxID=231269 RepID=A0A366SBU8_9HYPO|nr:uncharacterized protein FIESC28_00983 [Fusarium coffeatum]RBR26200.1 hypothetical protein FIESC28_00983 [Fusarium coffeatum]